VAQAHLGSIKMTVDTTDAVVGYDDYYPYGMQMSGRGFSSSADQRYKPACRQAGLLGRNLPSAGKLDATTGLDYFGARYYDSWRGQWIQVDPKASKYPSWSTYNYCLCSPIHLLDPNGMQVWAPAVEEEVMESIESYTPKIVEALTAVVVLVYESVPNHVVLTNDITNGYPGGAFSPPMALPKMESGENTEPQNNGSKAPDANEGDSPQHGKADHDAAVNKEVKRMQDAGHKDIRKNQAQVNAKGEKVGNNRPDVQGTNTKTGKREIVEIDRTQKKADKHNKVIKKNDPDAEIINIIIDK